MSTADRVRAAHSPQEAMLVIADALDEILAEVQREPSGKDPWGEWTSPQVDRGQEPVMGTAVDSSETFDEKHGRAVAAMRGTDAREIEIPKPSKEKIEQRRLLAKQQLKLNDVLPAEQGIDWDEVYAKGGPWWLYNADRGVVMQYDYSVRQQMVADVQEDSPELAYQMSIDVLKQPAGEPDFENGSGALAVGWVTGGKK